MENETNSSIAPASYYPDVAKPEEGSAEAPFAAFVAGYPDLNSDEVQRGGKKKRSKRRKTTKRKKKSTRSKSKARSKSRSRSRRRSRRGGDCGCEGKIKKKRGGSWCRSHKKKKSKKGKKKKGGHSCPGHTR